MSASLRLSILRAAESSCLSHGVDALSMAAVARALDLPLASVTRVFHDEIALLDAVLERHQAVYERGWEARYPSIRTPRDALRLLTQTIARQVHEQDGGAAYVAIAAQMSTSTRFTLTGRPATTSPAALKLLGKLMTATALPFDLVPIRFERFAVVLFTSTLAWYRQGSSRLAEDSFVEDLVDTLEFIALGVVSASAPPPAG